MYELKIRHIIGTITYVVILFPDYFGKLLCLKPTAEATKQIFMEKVYLVLRNNRESGPFTIGELLQQQLKPTDLVWIEGHSHSWSPVSSLKLIPSQDTDIPKIPETKAVQVSLTNPVDSTSNYTASQKTAAPAAYAIQREDEILFIDHRKEKKKNLIEWTSGIAVVGFIAVCLVGGIQFFRPKKEIPATVATQIISDESNKAKSVPAPTRSITNYFPQDTVAVPASPVSTHPQTPGKKRVTERAKPQMAALITEIESETSSTENKEEDKTEKAEVVPQKLLVENKLVVPASSNDTEVDSPEKKKSLGTALKGLFKKKKKDGEVKE